MVVVFKVTQAVMHDSGAPILGFERAEQPLELVAEASANLGLALGAEIYLAVNCAAAELMDHVSHQKP